MRCHAQDIAVEYATALAQSALDRASTGKGGKLQAEDVLFVVRKVTSQALLADPSVEHIVQEANVYQRTYQDLHARQQSLHNSAP